MSVLIHYVYSLYVGDALVYVGRSVNPKGRRRTFERRTGLVVDMLAEEFDTFEAAAAHELRLIKEYRPPYNKRLASSPTRLGQRNGEVQKQAASRALKGVAKTKEHRAKLWEFRTQKNDHGADGRFLKKEQ